MKTEFRIVRTAHLLALLMATVVISPAQMMGGGGHGGGYSGGNGGMMGSLGGMMGGSLTGMMGGNSGLAFGSDGTLYVTRSAVAQGPGQTVTTQLAAIDTNGKSKWTLPINADSASQPAIGKDGTLFITTSDWWSWMYGWMYDGSTPSDKTTANLLIITPGDTSASIALTVPLAGQVASAPQIATDNAGGYLVFVVTVDAFSGTGMNTSSASGSYLYAFSPAGTLRYRLQLSQGSSGMMGF